jgi:hypothetical protein
MTRAAEAARISRRSAWGWLQRDARFADAFRDAGEQAADLLETEARRRAIEGIEEPVIWQGQLATVPDPNGGPPIPLTIRKYSDTLLIFLLKGARPEKYRERYDFQHTGPGGGPVLVSDPIRTALADPEIRAALALAAHRMAQKAIGEGEMIEGSAVKIVEGAQAPPQPANGTGGRTYPETDE